MIYNTFKELNLSRLGFGTMRLPVLANGEIDQDQVEKMVDYAVAHGINYFDTAYPYHKGKSEISIGKALAKYERSSYYLADKYPGHQIAKEYHPEEIFEDQLKKCGVEYFDFYLLHNVYEQSINVYKSDKWKIVDYFIEQKRLGRIKHLGFSSHARLDVLKDFLDIYSDEMEFCQIQLNYLDWTLQDAKEKYELLTSYNVPVWVMEPIRGGKLAKLSDEDLKGLQTFDKDASAASYALRFVLDFPNVKMVLSGMSNFEQMVDNVKTLENYHPLYNKEREYLFKIAEGMKDCVPCTSCKYCLAGCPKGLDIPNLLKSLNDLRSDKTGNGSLTPTMQIECLDEDKLPSACIGCGACTKICPQHIDVATCIKELADRFDKLPKWKDMCAERAKFAEEAKMKK